MSQRAEDNAATEAQDCVQRVGEPEPYPVDVWTDDRASG